MACLNCISNPLPRRRPAGARYEDLAHGGAHVAAVLATDPDVRDSLAGGATANAAKAKKAKKLSKTKKAKLGAFRGKELRR